MDTLNKLQSILEGMENIGNQMAYERKVYQEELADRQAKGLTGDDAVKHYEEWMERCGIKV